MRTGNRKTLFGVVTGDRMTKTITVQVERRLMHAMYGKYIVRSRKLAVHDAKDEARAGDRVVIAETRPMSRRKRWRLVRVLERGHRPEEVAS